GAGAVGLVVRLVRGNAGADTNNGAGANNNDDDDSDTIIGKMAKAGALAHTKASLARLVTTSIVGIAGWSAPIAPAVTGPRTGHVLADEGVFFSKAAVVTFGGAYAVLAWVAQRAVALSWLSPKEVLDGLALGETTPGPLILVLEFVAFVAAARTWPGAHPL